jgi:hypothetical protein
MLPVLGSVAVSHPYVALELKAIALQDAKIVFPEVS